MQRIEHPSTNIARRLSVGDNAVIEEQDLSKSGRFGLVHLAEEREGVPARLPLRYLVVTHKCDKHKACAGFFEVIDCWSNLDKHHVSGIWKNNFGGFGNIIFWGLEKACFGDV